MFSEIGTYIPLFGGGVALLAALGQMFTKNKVAANYNLMMFHLTIGLLLFQCVSVFRGYCLINPWIMCYHLTLIWIQAPLLYLAHYYLVSDDELPRMTILKLFIPSIIAFAIDSVTIIAFLAGNIPHLLWIFQDPSLSWLIVKKYLLIAGAIQIIIYVSVFMWEMIPAWSWDERNSITTITLVYAASCILSTSFLLAGYITVDVKYLQTASNITSSFIIIITPIAQRYPRFLQILRTEVKKERYKKSLLAGKDVEETMLRLISLMEEEKLFRDENLSLKELACRVAMTPHQLSQLLNDNLNTSFRNFINRYRIEEAERILMESPRRPVLTIAFDVGFNNKTSFYDAFTKFKGVSPNRYRKDNLN